jgi:cyclohexanone monooxygenase
VSESKGVDRITEKGIVENGVEYEVDCIIFATGFEVGTAWTRRSGYDPIGKGGVRLSENWAKGMKTFHGFSSRGFPNMFLMGFSQNGQSVNLTSVLDDQAQHVAYIIKSVNARGARYSEPSAEAEAAWVAEIRRLAVMNVAFFESCTPGYYNNEGHIASRGGGFNGEAYTPGINAFNALIAAWREKGDLEGLELG